MATYYAQLFNGASRSRSLTASEFAELAYLKRVDVTHLAYGPADEYGTSYLRPASGPLVPGQAAPEATYPFYGVYGKIDDGWGADVHAAVSPSDVALIDGCVVAYEAGNEFLLSHEEPTGSLSIYDWGGDGAGVEFSRVGSSALGLVSFRIFLLEGAIPLFWADHVNTQEIVW